MSVEIPNPSSSLPSSRSSRWRSLWANTVSLLFPPQCVACQTDMPSPVLSPQDPKALPGLCTPCQRSLVFLEGPLCPKCAHPTQHPTDTPCHRCIRRTPAFRRAFSVFAYVGAVRKALHRYKLRGDHTTGRFLQQWFRQQIQYLPISWTDYDMVSCVPLHPEKLQQRGFNQALQLLSALALPDTQCQPFLLDRAKKTKPLYEQNLHERQSHLYQAFVVRSSPEHDVSRKRILLVDDLLTTGATAHQCCVSLHRAGAAFVDILTLCRAIL